MMTHEMSQIDNWLRCGANIPAGYDVAAVVAEVTEGWGRDAYEATLASGLSTTDREVIAEVIAEHELTCSVETCEAAILDACRTIAER